MDLPSASLFDRAKLDVRNLYQSEYSAIFVIKSVGGARAVARVGRLLGNGRGRLAHGLRVLVTHVQQVSSRGRMDDWS
jgi:hypothetical protein